MYDLISFVARSKTRTKLLKALDIPRTPTQLAKELDIHRSSASRDIIALEEKGLVKCLTPKEKLFRLYQITDKGKKILKEVNKVTS